MALGVGGARNYTFDAAGSLDLVTAGANVIDFVPDEEGRQASLVRGAESATFTYDGRSFLSRVERAAGAEFTGPIYGSDGLLHSLTRQGPVPDPLETVNYFYFAGRPVAQLKDDGTTSSWTFLTTDHLGTPLLATDLSKNEIWRGPFEPFGRDVNQAAPSSARGQGIFLGFPGQWDDGRWQDASAGADLYYNVHRWYEFGTGNYSRVDPLGLREGASLYGYAESNPLYLADPLGLAPCACTDDCPGGEWSYAGGGGSGAGIGGRAVSFGFASCDSNPEARVFLRSECWILGLIAVIGLGGDFTTGSAPAFCGCSVDDILGVSNQFLGALGPFGGALGACDESSSGRQFTFGLSVAKSFGGGVAWMRCRTKRIFDS